MTVLELREALRSMPANAPVEMVVGAAAVELDQVVSEAFYNEGVVVQLKSFDSTAGAAIAAGDGAAA